MGAPPTIMVTLSLRPCSLVMSMMVFMTVMVVVMRADIPQKLQPPLISSMNFWVGTSRPRSWTSNPAHWSMVEQMDFPMSWTSPSTVPMTAVPSFSVDPPAAASLGPRISIALFIPAAAERTWGRKSLPFWNRTPTSVIPADIASMMAVGAIPAASALLTASMMPGSLTATIAS